MMQVPNEPASMIETARFLSLVSENEKVVKINKTHSKLSVYPIINMQIFRSRLYPRRFSPNRGRDTTF